MFADVNQIQQAFQQTSREQEPIVDLVEGFAIGWVVGGWLKKLAGK